MRLPTKPSHTPACTPTLPIFLAMAIEVAITSAPVFSARTISSKRMMLAGEKKCRPTTSWRALGDGGDLVDVEGGGVGGDDGAGLGDLVELGEDLLLQRHVLEHRLDDEVGLAEILELQRRGELRHALLGLRLGGAAALHVGIERVLDAGDALVEGLLRGLDDGEREAGVEEGKADAGAHGAGTEDADRLHVAQLGVGADAGQVGRLPLGEEGILQRPGVGAHHRLADQRPLARETLLERQRGGRLHRIDRRLWAPAVRSHGDRSRPVPCRTGQPEPCRSSPRRCGAAACPPAHGQRQRRPPPHRRRRPCRSGRRPRPWRHR